MDYEVITGVGEFFRPPWWCDAFRSDAGDDVTFLVTPFEPCRWALGNEGDDSDRFWNVK